jgi:hypothetical protein
MDTSFKHSSFSLNRIMLSLLRQLCPGPREADLANRWDSVQPTNYSGVALLCTDMNYYCKGDVVALAAALVGVRLAALLQLLSATLQPTLEACRICYCGGATVKCSLLKSKAVTASAQVSLKLRI